MITDPNGPLSLLGGLSAAEFLTDYWQKKALFVKGAVPDVRSPVSGDELAGMAGDEVVESRIVRKVPGEHRWLPAHGPFDAADFSALPESGWTLLVTDMDKWLAEAEAFMDLFDFLPRWRFDDVMISYAEDGGSVGPHIDNYDVFLIQAEGVRRWQIDENAVVGERKLIADCELAILEEFSTTREWLVEPGDLLYLPPGLPHYGVARGQCMSISVGLRAPADHELIGDLADEIAARCHESQRVTDRERAPTTQPGQLSKSDRAAVRKHLRSIVALDDASLDRWFGRFISRYRLSQEPVSGGDSYDPTQLQRALDGGAVLHRSPWSRSVCFDEQLFVAGESFSCNRDLALLLCNHRELDSSRLARHRTDEKQLELLCVMLNRGYWVVGDESG